MGAILFWARKYDTALDKTLEALEMTPDFGTVHFVLGWIYEQKKMYKEAISAFKTAINILGFPYMGPLLGHCYGISGKKKEAEKIITELNKLPKEQYVSSYHRSSIYIALEDNDQAFELLEDAFENRDNWLVIIKIDPRFDNLRSDSRYIQLLKKLQMHQ